MTILQSVLLGAIQGLAEFLPISSSGHLALASRFFGQSSVPVLFDILLHLATLLAVCIVFWKRIAELLGTTGRWIVRKSLESDRDNLKIIVSLLVGTVMTVVIGFAIKDWVENLAPLFISVCLVITGVLLVVSGKYQSKKEPTPMNVRKGIFIGIAQGIGVIPGISRSGITISAALLSGVDRKTAGEFSFLLSIPAILGAFILELKDADTLNATVSIFPLIAGMATAFVVGFFSLKVLLKLINRGKLGWFAFYLIPAGISLAIYFMAVAR